jgi:flagellin
MLGVTTSAQAKSTEKLSSGYKINRAADDAAGLSISEKMRKQIRGLTQATSNAQDGISAVQTAEGGLNEVHDMLQRMNELATKAANGTNSSSDRQSIQDEVDQLTTEIDRVAETTKFNEIYLLKGGSGEKKVFAEAHDAGLDGTLADKGDSAIFTMRLDKGDDITIAGKEYHIMLSTGEHDTVVSIQGLISTATSITIEGTTYTRSTAKASTKFKANGNEYTQVQLQALVKNGTKVVFTSGNMKGSTKTAVNKTVSTNITFANAINYAAQALAQANKIGVDRPNSVTVKVSASYKSKTPVDGNAVSTTNIQFSITKGAMDVEKELNFNLHVGADADMTNKIGVNIDVMNSKYLGVKDLNVKDDTGNAATYAIDAIADAIAKVSAQRSSLGAVQNRLDHTIKNLNNIVENTTSAESQIRDTDMATEMVTYSKNNILAQAGQSMLAQANQSNQGVLSLLQ